MQKSPATARSAPNQQATHGHDTFLGRGVESGHWTAWNGTGILYFPFDLAWSFMEQAKEFPSHIGFFLSFLSSTSSFDCSRVSAQLGSESDEA